MRDHPRQTTGQEHNGKVQSRKNLNLEGQSLVLLYPFFWVGIPPPTIEHAIGSHNPVHEKKKMMSNDIFYHIFK